MAKKIILEHPVTGEKVTGFYGYSWTSLFFGVFVPLFRWDFKTFFGIFAVLALLGISTFLLVFPIVLGILFWLIWSFMYNVYYTRNLIRKGYKLSGSTYENMTAVEKLRLRLNANNCLNFQEEEYIRG